MFPAGAATDRAFGADKRDPVDLAVQIHGLRNISTAAAVRAVVRSHSFSPLAVDGIVHDAGAQFTADCSVLRITNKNRTSTLQLENDEAANITDKLPSTWGVELRGLRGFQ